MKKIILASKSPRRKELLSAYGFDFDIVVTDVEEIDSSANMSAIDIPVFNAKKKALAISEKYPDSLVIGVDTVIVFDNKVIGKPKDMADAKNILSMLSGKHHQVVSAVAVLRKNDDTQIIFSESTDVMFNSLSENDIDVYLKHVHVLDKAGAYAIQECGNMIIESIDGEVENVIGLPRCRLIESLTSLS